MRLPGRAAASISTTASPRCWPRVVRRPSPRGSSPRSCFALGVIVLVVLISPLPLHQPVGPPALAAVVVACFVTGAIWLRDRWPDRTESALLAAGSMIGVPVACLAPVDPMYGIVGAPSFALMIGYAALLHGMRLLSADRHGRDTDHRISRDPGRPSWDVLMAVASTVMLLLLIAFAAFSCRLVVRLTGTAVGPDGFEPLTGLLNRESFYEQTATLLASRNPRRRPLPGGRSGQHRQLRGDGQRAGQPRRQPRPHRGGSGAAGNGAGATRSSLTSGRPST